MLARLFNPLDRLLHRWDKEGKKSFFILWNRGLGDVALGLYGLCYKIRQKIPEASITFLTREDLATAFELLEGAQVLVDQDMVRGKPYDIVTYLKKLGKPQETFDVVLETIDTKRWLAWQLGRLTPRLKWNTSWDRLSERFSLGKACLGVHLSSETSSYYRYEKNWPEEKFRELFDKVLASQDQDIVLFGMQAGKPFIHPRIKDLRGQTSFLEMMAIIKNHCSHLLAPDSGVLSIVYYLDEAFPLKVVSLWADPRQGILKQKVASPNRALHHYPLLGHKEAVQNISVEHVFKTLYP
ncbi:MAG: glycosyltransferase family 9 protein [Chlamydiae bacterium]|nr:glycosyltransferase family 9 protein [Chlamydiota bacterium]